MMDMYIDDDASRQPDVVNMSYQSEEENVNQQQHHQRSGGSNSDEQMLMTKLSQQLLQKDIDTQHAAMCWNTYNTSTSTTANTTYSSRVSSSSWRSWWLHFFSILTDRSNRRQQRSSGGGGDVLAVDDDDAIVPMDIVSATTATTTSLSTDAAAPMPSQQDGHDSITINNNNAMRNSNSSQCNVGKTKRSSSMRNTTQYDKGLMRHMLMPYIITGYLQLFFNIVLLSSMLYLCYGVYSAIAHDVRLRREQYSAEVVNEILECKRMYDANRCYPLEGRIPAIEKQCDQWQTCMNRNPDDVGKARVTAQTLAEILNSFVEPISYKTMLFFFLLVVSCALLSNIGLKMVKDSSSHKPTDIVKYNGGRIINSNSTNKQRLQ